MEKQNFNQGNRSGYSGQQGGGSRGGYSSQQDRGDRVKHDFPIKEYDSALTRWITEKIDRETIGFAEKAGKYLAENKMTTSQIRIAFGQLRKIQMNGFTKMHTHFLMLTPKLAYAAERHKEKGTWMFYEFFKFAASKVDIDNLQEGQKQFDNLLQVVEGVLAYHKSFGGKD